MAQIDLGIDNPAAQAAESRRQALRAKADQLLAVPRDADGPLTPVDAAAHADQITNADPVLPADASEAVVGINAGASATDAAPRMRPNPAQGQTGSDASIPTVPSGAVKAQKLLDLNATINGGAQL